MRDVINNTDGIGIRHLFNYPARQIVSVDIDRYKSLIDDPTLSETEKEEFLQALWSIVATFVELGFGVHPLQEVCEDEHSSLALKSAFDRVDDTASNDKNKKDGSPASGPEA